MVLGGVTHIAEGTVILRLRVFSLFTIMRCRFLMISIGAGMKKIILVFAVFITATFSSTAVDYPNPAEEYVNDFAGVISDADAGRIRALLGNIESQTGIEITVTTINSLADYQAGTNLRSYAAQLFDKWGVGDSRRNDGVMILFSNKDREVWIEAGLGYNNRFNAEFQKVVDTEMLPYFREGTIPEDYTKEPPASVES